MPHCRGDRRVRPGRRAVQLARDRGASSPSCAATACPALTGVDTRRLTRHVRDAGAVPVRVRHGARGRAACRGRGRAVGTDGWTWCRASPRPSPASTPATGAAPASGLRIVAYDFGVKAHHGRAARRRSATVTVVPAATPADEVLALEPDGVFLSNGPGDPAALPGPTAAVADLVGRRARSSASASATRSWPPRSAARPTSCPSATTAATTRCSAWRPAWSRSPARTTTTRWPRARSPTPRRTHVNLNDGVIEGFRSLDGAGLLRCSTTPRRRPGPHDARYLFGEFRDLMLAHPAPLGRRRAR